MKKFLFALAGFFLLLSGTVKADEGMWLLPLLDKLNIKNMKKAGCQLTAEQIYSINKSSLKDAIVVFGGGCTAELISSEGLLLTNHHCGYGTIQKHSSVEHDYLRDGFWAEDRSKEIVSPGLSVTFLDRIDDVTDKILPELNKIESEADRSKKQAELIESLLKDFPKDEFTRVVIVPLYGGNVFYLFKYTIYKDVRFVGAPPSSIGKFGADSDNWMWPRHTGDFALFRVYATKDGKPANPSEENVPYKPKNYLTISLKGIQEGDFAMVMGYPGRTYRFMTSYEVEEMASNNEQQVLIRGIRQDVWMKAMLADQKTRIQYSSKYAGSSNGWKKYQGMNETFQKLDVVGRRAEQEQRFTSWVNANEQRKQQYSEALTLVEQAVTQRKEANKANQATLSCIGGIELVKIAATLDALYKAGKENEDAKLKAEAAKLLAEFYKDYNVTLDKNTALVVLPVYIEKVPKEYWPEAFKVAMQQYENNVSWYVTDLFENSIFSEEEAAKRFIDNPEKETFEADMAVVLVKSINELVEKLGKETIKPANELYSKGVRLYIAGLMEMDAKKAMYPDANSTMRLTYGNVKGYKPRDGVEYDYYTTLAGVMEKEDPNNWEFVVPAKLKDLYHAKDFGQYAMKDGTMPVNFIFNGDITGGNSGSPVLNKKGELIGTAFDGNWEAMSGDVLFEPDLQRCINVDIRYTLFIIDKFAGAKHLVDEMTIVR